MKTKTARREVPSGLFLPCGLCRTVSAVFRRIGVQIVDGVDERLPGEVAGHVW